MRQTLRLAILFCALLGLVISSQAKPRIYKWVEDKRVSSKDVLDKGEWKRVIPVTESQTLDLVKLVMTEDLYLALAAYRQTRHQQEAETTVDSVLPEAIVRDKEVELADEDYGFILKVKLNRYGSRTRVEAEARPVYRLRDYDAEAARDEDTDTADNTIEVKVKADQGNAVAVGPIIVAPIIGFPTDYGITPLPDAAERAAALVRSFVYFLDKRIQVRQKSLSPAQVEPAVSSPSTAVPEPAASAGNTSAGKTGVEVDIKIKTPKQ